MYINMNLKIQKSLWTIPEKNTWGRGGVRGRRQAIYTFLWVVGADLFFKLYGLLVFDKI